jgi:hypothetical protein
MRMPNELSAELHGPVVVDGHLLDPASDAVTRLEHEHVGAAKSHLSEEDRQFFD